MTWNGSGKATASLASRFAIAVAALAAASLSISACEVIVGSCHCPTTGGTVLLPAAQSTPIVTVSTDQPCWATASGGSPYINVSRGNAGTCNVRATLANGDVWAFSIEFRSIDPGGCCADVTRIAGTPVAQRIAGGDGGAVDAADAQPVDASAGG